MKTTHVLLGIIAIGVIATALVLGFSSNSPVSQTGGNFATEVKYLGHTSTTLAYNATSTMMKGVPAGAASSTLIWNCENAEQIDMDLAALASSTATKWQWTVGFTNDNLSSAAHHALWFYESAHTVDSNISITHGANPVVHYWTPGQTATSTKNVTITPVAAKYCRVDITATGANGMLWMAVVSKKNY